VGGGCGISRERKIRKGVPETPIKKGEKDFPFFRKTAGDRGIKIPFPENPELVVR